MQHTNQPVRIVPREELLPSLGVEAYLPVVLVADADAAQQHLARPPVPRAVRGPPPHLHAVRPTAPPAATHLSTTSLEYVVGEEVDVAGRLVEVVGAEALVDLGREDF